MARGTWGTNETFGPFDVRVKWRVGTSQHQTGFTVRPAATLNPTPEQIAGFLTGWVTGNFRTLLYVLDELLSLDVVNLVSGEGFTQSYSNQAGTQAASGGVMPAYVCVSAVLKGELRKKYGQGRMMLPVRPESWSEGELLAGAGVTAIQGVVDSLAALIVGDPLTNNVVMVNTHGVLPPKAATPTRPARPEIPASYYDVTAILLNQQTTFLRSRKAGVGS